MNIGIVGASGYSGEVLLTLLLRHPHIEVTAVTSRTRHGQTVQQVFPALKNRAGELSFTASDPRQLAENPHLDLVFLALPHGVASEYAIPLCRAGKKVVDLSADYRLSSAALYRQYYGRPHPHPDWLSKSSYVIPEVAGEAWKGRRLIAAPGCYPTSILIPLIPLLRDGILPHEGIVINSMSGISGAGRKVAEDFIYCERNESVKAYGLANHRHIPEIEEQLGSAAGGPVLIQFTPHLAPMNRGIATTITVPKSGAVTEAVYQSWQKAYAAKPFVGLLDSGNTPDTKHVVYTNRVDISATWDERTDHLIITSALDNLTKGAAGQAIQIMNHWLGFEETAGLL